MRYDEFLEKIGGFGRYQLLVFVLLSFMSIKAGMERQLCVYFVYTPLFACDEPWNSTQLSETCQSSQGDNVTKCTKWSYDQSVLRKTIVTEFDLVCDFAFFGDLLLTVGFIGSGCGSLVAFAADKFGRRNIILFSVAFEMITSVAMIFAPDLKAVFIFGFLRGMGAGNYIQGFTYLTEIVSSRYCAFVGITFWITLSLGYAAAGAIGKYIQEWRLMQLTASLVTTAYFSYLFLVWESPRWLLAVGRKREAITILKRVARVNGRSHCVTDEQFESLRVENAKTARGRFMDIFSSPTMRLKTVFSWILVYIGSASYYGIILNHSFATDDIFLNTIFMGFIETPSYIFSAIIGAKFGRRWPSIILILVTSTVIFAVPHFPSDSSLMWLKTITAIVGKFGATTSYTIFFLWASELQPVNVRSVGFFSSVVCHYLGSVVSPHIIRLHEIQYWLPSVIFGGQCFIGAIMMMFLPDTKGIPLQQTVEEADLLVVGKEKKFAHHLTIFHDEATTKEEMLMLESTA